jgi:hypothetical protein
VTTCKGQVSFESQHPSKPRQRWWHRGTINFDQHLSTCKAAVTMTTHPDHAFTDIGFDGNVCSSKRGLRAATRICSCGYTTGDISNFNRHVKTCGVETHGGSRERSGRKPKVDGASGHSSMRPVDVCCAEALDKFAASTQGQEPTSDQVREIILPQVTEARRLLGKKPILESTLLTHIRNWKTAHRKGENRSGPRENSGCKQKWTIPHSLAGCKDDASQP